MARRISNNPGSASALARLLSREAELETRLCAARERAETLVREAEEAARGRRARLEADLAASAAAIERQHADSCAERIAVIVRDRARAVERLRAIDSRQIVQLAEWVVEDVLHEANASDRGP